MVLPVQYLGGKARTAKRITPILAAHAAPGVTYWEPFLGGGSVAALAVPRFERSILSDVMPDLVLMWQALADGWTPPANVTEEEYQALRHAPPSALRGFVGFGCSFGAKWFGGYARDARKRCSFAETAAQGVAPKVASIRGAEIRTCSYAEASPAPGDVAYLDPPYVAATGYTGTPPFDHAALWATAEQWAREGVHVYVSEFSAPDGWERVWSAPHVNSMRRATGRTDTLFHHALSSRGAATTRRGLPTGAGSVRARCTAPATA